MNSIAYFVILGTVSQLPEQGGSAPAELGYASPAAPSSLPHENSDDIPF